MGERGGETERERGKEDDAEASFSAPTASSRASSRE
jgi:hypothetical protein